MSYFHYAGPLNAIMIRQKNAQFHIQHTTFDKQATIYDRLIEFCIISLIIFTPLTYGAVLPWPIAVFEVISALMFLFWIFKMLSNGKLEFIRNPLTPFIFLFIFYISLQFFSTPLTPHSSLVTLSVSDVWSPGSVYPWATKTELLKVIAYVIIFIVTLNTIKTRQQINRMLSIIIAVGFVMGIFFIMRYLGAKAPQGFINRDHYSAYLGMIIPLALGFLFVISITTDRYSQTAKRALLFFCVIVMSTALFFTMSRGGMLSFISALLFMAFLVWRRKSIRGRGWILSAVGIFVILTIMWFGAAPVIERILSIKTEIASRYIGGRLSIWQGTADIIKDYPVFGTGLGTFNYIFPKYEPAIIKVHFAYAHNDFLELIAETGIIGFAVFAAFGLVAVVWLFRRFLKRYDPYVTGISIGILGSLASIFVHSFTDFSLKIPANAILLAIILALLISILYLDNRHNTLNCRTLNIPGVAKNILYPVSVLLAGIFILISVRPAVADYYFQKSYLSQTSNSKLQIDLLKKAIKLDPTDAAYHYQLGKLYSKIHTIHGVRQTIDEYKKAVELNYMNSKYHQSLAWTYGILADLNKRNTIDAMRTTKLVHEHFQEAARLEPNNPYRRRAYAVWLFNHPTEKNIEKGVEKYRKAVDLEPKLAEEAFNRYYKLTKNYDLLSNIIPDTIEAHFLLWQFYEKKELYDESSEEKKILLAKPSGFSFRASPDIYIKRGEIYESLGKHDRAVSEYKKALRLNPKNAGIYYKMGLAYLRKKRIQQAIESFAGSLEVDSSYQWSYYQLALIYKSQGKKLEAEQMWQAILALENPDLQAEKIARRELKINDK